MKLRSAMRLMPMLAALAVLCTAQVEAQAENSAADNTAQPAKDAAKSATPEKKATHVAHHEGPARYATETQARAHCRGRTVLWVDKDNLDHYPGSADYGRKPGAFICATE